MAEQSTTPKVEHSQVLSLLQMAAYQEGSIVSRQIAKNEAGNVTLFAFDAGQQLSEHTTAFDALVQVLDGEAEIRISGQASLVRAGEAILMPANVPHALFAPVRFKMLLTMLRA